MQRLHLYTKTSTVAFYTTMETILIGKILLHLRHHSLRHFILQTMSYHTHLQKHKKEVFFESVCEQGLSELYFIIFIIIAFFVAVYSQLQMKEQAQTQDNQNNDLQLPLNPESTFMKFILRNKEISLHFKSTLVCLSIGFLLFFILSIAMFAAMPSNTTLVFPYYQKQGSTCQSAPSNCIVTFQIPDDLQPPIYLSYQLQNFYQNQRLFVQSKSNKQLSGQQISQNQAHLCRPFISNSDLNVSVSWGGTPLDPNGIASPCGAIAKYFFNDTFSLFKDGNRIDIDQTGISWPGDQGGSFQQAANSLNTQWINPQNEHFIVWMRTAGLPNFFKPWGIINTPLSSGNYTMSITNNYKIRNWDQTKSFIVSTVGLWGGKNYLLPVAMLLVSVGCLIAVFVIGRIAFKFKNALEKHE